MNINRWRIGNPISELEAEAGCPLAGPDLPNRCLFHQSAIQDQAGVSGSPQTEPRAKGSILSALCIDFVMQHIQK